MGLPKAIKTPKKMYELFQQYKDYCKANPKKENVLIHRTGEIAVVNREVPYTWVGFEVWLGMNDIVRDLRHYRYNHEGRYGEFVPIIHTINSEIYLDKYNGGVTNIYQHNIIARDLGLIDKKEVKSVEIKPIEYIDATNNENTSTTASD